MSIVLDEKLEMHLDEVLSYWQRIYFEYEQRAARIATAGGILATLFGSRLIGAAADKAASFHEVTHFLGYVGVTFIVASSLISLSIFLPLTHRGTIGILELYKSQRRERDANLAVREAAFQNFPETVHEWSQQLFWVKAHSTDTTSSFRLRSKLTAVSHFRRMSSLRGLRNTLSIYLLILGSLTILAAGGFEIALR